MNDIVTGEAVAAESFIAKRAFDVSVKQLVFVVERTEGAIGEVIVRIDKAAVTLLLEIEQAKAMADGDTRT